MGIAKDSVYNLCGTLVPTFVTLLTVPMYLSVIGVERYGALSICWLMLGYVGFLNLGLGPAVGQMLASTRRETNAFLDESLFWSAIWISLIMGVFGAVAVYGFASIYFSIAISASTFSEEIRVSTPLLASIIPIIMVSGVLSGALQGKERFLALNVTASLTATLIAIIPLLIGYLISPRLELLIAGAVITRLGSLLVLYVLCVEAIPLRRPRLLKWATVKPLLRFGGWVTLTNLIAPFLTSIDRLLIGGLLGMQAVSIYTIPYALVSRLQLIPQSISMALLPRFAYSNKNEGTRLEVEGMAALSFVMTPAVIILAGAVGPFLHLWVGSDIAEKAAPIAFILLIGRWVNSFARVPYSRLIGSGRPDLVAKILIAELLPYIAVLILSTWAFGLIGAAVAWTMRTCADSLLFFIVSGRPRGSIGPLAVSCALVMAACASAAMLPYTDPRQWVLIGTLFIVALILAINTAPDAARRFVKKVFEKGTALIGDSTIRTQDRNR